MTADTHPSGASTEPPINYDDPVLYDPAGMRPQCTYIVHWHSCRLDAGHKGAHSPGRAGAASTEATPPHEHEWERLFRDGVAVAARCKVCRVTPLEWLDQQPLRASTEATERPDLRAAEQVTYEMKVFLHGAKMAPPVAPGWLAQIEKWRAALAGASPSEPSRSVLERQAESLKMVPASDRYSKGYNDALADMVDGVNRPTAPEEPTDA